MNDKIINSTINSHSIITIILPGITLVYYFYIMYGIATIDTKISSSETQQYIVFFVSSFVIGYILNSISSILDDILYYKIKNYFFPISTRELFKTVRNIKNKRLNEKRGQELINPYKWSKTFIHLHNNEAYTQVIKIESTSKLFRSFSIVFLIISLSSIYLKLYIIAIFIFVLSLFSIYIYAKYRNEQVKMAYLYAIEIDNINN